MSPRDRPRKRRDALRELGNARPQFLKKKKKKAEIKKKKKGGRAALPAAYRDEHPAFRRHRGEMHGAIYRREVREARGPKPPRWGEKKSGFQAFVNAQARTCAHAERLRVGGLGLNG